MKIIWKDAVTGIWSEITTLEPTLNYENYMVDVSAAAGTNYLAFVPICDDPWSWGGELTMDNIIAVIAPFSESYPLSFNISILF